MTSPILVHTSSQLETTLPNLSCSCDHVHSRQADVNGSDMSNLWLTSIERKSLPHSSFPLPDGWEMGHPKELP